ncbi:hypothetical protein ACFSKU_19050 [Pontibacter silvestris]|uniref:Uncharacterized protein n=1 Tax=Pontibacter silvestris TaxID=2305183 RepID=A0ABW4X471_9BACT|nr:hypothetical protein [Pontibacter silvestris]MCC9135009.1 hypothetical protein [Pontibacter silvestris]
MDTLNKALKFTFASCFALLLLSCEGNREISDNNEITVDADTSEDTARVVKTGETTEEKLEEFRGWLNTQAAKGDTAIRSEWPEVKDKLRQRNAELEQNFENLSAQSKQEFRNLQNRYEEWEERQDQRQQQPLDSDVATQWQDQLLGEYDEIDNITPNNIREAYLTFMGVVRTKRRNWSQNDWDYVDHIYSKLNQRRRQIEDQIGTRDNLKIRSLQAEYLTLESAADAGSLASGVSDDN